MRLITKTQWMVLVDLLLPAAALTFLLPINPSISSIPSVLWVLLQLTFAPNDRRWAAWPMVFVLLLFSRSWWLHEMPHPGAAQDGLLLVGALMASACLPATRWPWLLRLPLLVLPVLLFEMGSKPWTPNPLAGVNQGGFVLGVIFLVALAWFWQTKQSQWQRLLAGSATVLAGLMVWQTGSRAAVVATVVSAALVWIKEGSCVRVIWKRGLLLMGFGVVALVAKQLLRPSSTGIPGLHLTSDSGRLALAQCYAALPFSGNNRFIYGIGFDRAGQFCADPIRHGMGISMHGGVADHSHNMFLQLFASTGVLGLFGFLLLLAMLFQAWHISSSVMDAYPRQVGQMVLVYTLIQGCLDLSILHWPVTLVLSGVLLGIPLSWQSSGPHVMKQN